MADAPVVAEQPPVNTPFYLDKALWMVLLNPLLILVGKKLGIELNGEEIIGIVLGVVSFIVMHKYSSTKKALAVYANAPNQLNK